MVRGLLAAESNYRVTVHIRDLGVEELVRSLFKAEGSCRVTVYIRELGVPVEKLSLKPIPECEH